MDDKKMTVSNECSPEKSDRGFVTLLSPKEDKILTATHQMLWAFQNLRSTLPLKDWPFELTQSRMEIHNLHKKLINKQLKLRKEKLC